GVKSWALPILAARSSSLMDIEVISEYGDTASATPSMSCMSSTVAETSERACCVRIVEPSGATTIRYALDPLRSRKVRFSESIASCDSGPGMSNESWVVPPKPATANPNTPRRASQADSTRPRYRHAHRPREQRDIDT